MRTLGLIPAKAHSRGIPGKNWKPLGGSHWTDSPAVRAYHIAQLTCDAVRVSVDQVPDLPVQLPYIYRPAELAQDDTPMLDVVQHAVRAVAEPFDVVVLLQPTQPLRRPEHVRDALRLLEAGKADSVVSVVEIPPHYSPFYALEKTTLGELTPFAEDESAGPRPMDFGPKWRQSISPTYSRDGTVYAIRREVVEAGSLYGECCLPLIIPSAESVNLDTEEDWQFAEWRLSREVAHA